MHLTSSTAYSIYIAALEKASQNPTVINRLRASKAFKRYLVALKQEKG